MSVRQKLNALIVGLTSTQIALLVSRSALRAFPYTCTDDRGNKLDLWPEEGLRFEYLHHVFTALAATGLAASMPVLPKNPQITFLRDELQLRVKPAAAQRIKRLLSSSAENRSLLRAETALLCIIHAVRSIRNERTIKCATDCLETEMGLGLTYEFLAAEVAAIKLDGKATFERHAFEAPGSTDPRSAQASELWLILSQAILEAHPEMDHWIKWCGERTSGANTDVESFKKRVFLPKEVKRNVHEVNAYLRNLSAESFTLDRVRVIVLGWNQSGKSTLVRALLGQPVSRGSTDMTPGIDIHQWRPVPSIEAHMWDFGGQVIAHATHQFFLRSRCLYIVVIDGRADLDPEVQAEYWLQHVRSFGADSPVMLVCNKADELRVNMVESEISRKYANIASIHHVAAACYRTTHKEQFDAFKADLIENIRGITDNQVRFTREQHAVLRKLTTLAPNQPYIKEDDYARICREFNVSDEGELGRKWLLRLLDELGAIVYFEGLIWAKPFILNPQWLTIGVYTLIYSKRLAETNGVLTTSDLLEIFSMQTFKDGAGNRLHYPPEMCHFIIEVMRHFKLCYELPNERGTYIIPGLLPSEKPRFDFDKSEALQFRFCFSQLLPPHILPMLIVQCHAELVRNCVWQRGALFCSSAYPETRALVEVVPVDRRVLLTVSGPASGLYFASMHNEISKLIALMPSLEVMHEIALPARARQNRGAARPATVGGVEWTNFAAVLANAREGEYRIMAPSSTVYNAETVLRPIPEAQRETIVVTINHANSVTFNANPSQKIVEELGQSARDLAREIDRILKDSETAGQQVDVEAKQTLIGLKEAIVRVDGQPRREKRGTLEAINTAVTQLETNDSSLYQLLWKMYRADEVIGKMLGRCNDVASLIARLVS